MTHFDMNDSYVIGSTTPTLEFMFILRTKIYDWVFERWYYLPIPKKAD